MDVHSICSPYFGQLDASLPENPLVALKRKIKEEPGEERSSKCPFETSIPENPLVALKKTIIDEPKEKDSYSNGVVKEEIPQTPKKVKQEKITDHLIVKKKRDRFNGMSEEEVMSRLLPDHLAPNLDIVIIGINPGLFAAHVGHHYAGPGNHFWKCLSLSGLTPTLMTGYDDFKLIDHGIGFTNICSRTTKGSADLSKKEIKEGAVILKEKLLTYKPKIAVFNGKGIYEVFVGHKNFHFGKQPERLESSDTFVYVMPSSSARCSQLPRAVDKVPFYVALKKLRDHLRGDLPELDESEVCFPDVELKTAKSEKTESNGAEVKQKGKRGRKKKEQPTSPYPVGQHWMHSPETKPYFMGTVPNTNTSSQTNYNFPVTTYPSTTTGEMFNPVSQQSQQMSAHPFSMPIKQEARTDDQSYGCMSKGTNLQGVQNTFSGQFPITTCVGSDFQEMQNLYAASFPAPSISHLNPNFQNNSFTQQAHFTSHNSHDSQFRGSFLEELNSCPAPPSTLSNVVTTMGGSAITNDMVQQNSHSDLGITIKSEPLDVL